MLFLSLIILLASGVSKAFLTAPRESVTTKLLTVAFSTDPILDERRWEQPVASLDFLTPLEMQGLESAMTAWKWNANLREIANAVLRASSYFNQDPYLMLAIIKVESEGRSSAQSSANARGLMQLLPGTGQYIAKNTGVHWRGTEALHQEAYNVVLGVGYFDYLMEQVDGDKQLALAAYNWGPGNVQKVGYDFFKVPSEVRRYASKVLGIYRQLLSVRNGRSTTLSQQ
jgi:soluble lytic murein transglycosylase